MFAEDWLLALITTVILPLAILPSVRIGRSMRKVSGKNQVQVGRLTTLLDEAFQGIRHVKAYVMERYESKRADAAIEEVFRLNQESARSEEHTSELQSLMRISYAVFCLKKKKQHKRNT